MWLTPQWQLAPFVHRLLGLAMSSRFLQLSKDRPRPVSSMWRPRHWFHLWLPRRIRALLLLLEPHRLLWNKRFLRLRHVNVSHSQYSYYHLFITCFWLLRQIEQDFFHALSKTKTTWQNHAKEPLKSIKALAAHIECNRTCIWEYDTSQSRENLSKIFECPKCVQLQVVPLLCGTLYLIWNVY